MRRLRACASALLSLSATTTLVACQGAGLPSSVAHRCLAVSAAGAVVPLKGYPASLVEQAFRKRGGAVHFNGDVLELTDRDRLTGKVSRLRFQLNREPSTFHSDQCGPGYLTLSRLATDGEIIDGLSLQDLAFSMVQSLASEVGTREPIVPPDPPEPVSALQPPSKPLPPPAGMPPANTMAPTPVADGDASSSPGARADAPGPAAGALSYTPTYRACMAGGEAARGASSAVQACTEQELTLQDGLLNQRYRAAMAARSPAQQAELRAQERAWIRDRNAGCRRQMETAGRSLGSQLYSKCVLDRTIDRTRALANSAAG